MLAAKMRLRTCRAKDCTEKFRPWSSMQSACSPSCALAITREANQKKARRELREAKESIRTKPQWTKLAQSAFNAYVRLRDADQPCISCGIENPPDRYGGAWDCGHFKTVGAFPELRFEPLNANRQCKSCNGGSGNFSHKARTVTDQYRERLVARIGQANVDWLDGPHAAANYTIDDLKQIIAQYRAEVREMKRKHD